MPKKSEHALALFHAHVGIEIWKHVHDFPFVEVSNLGRVRRWWKSIGYRIINGRDMKGYLSIRINDKNFFIHRLVAKTFIPNPYHKTNNRIMNNSVTRDGYIRVSIEKYKCRELVHRLVAKAFIQNPEPNIKLQVNHKNMDRSNCCVNNLEWVTCSENILHSYKHRKV